MVVPAGFQKLANKKGFFSETGGQDLLPVAIHYSSISQLVWLAREELGELELVLKGNMKRLSTQHNHVCCRRHSQVHIFCTVFSNPQLVNSQDLRECLCRWSPNVATSPSHLLPRNLHSHTPSLSSKQVPSPALGAVDTSPSFQRMPMPGHLILVVSKLS